MNRAATDGALIGGLTALVDIALFAVTGWVHPIQHHAVAENDRFLRNAVVVVIDQLCASGAHVLIVDDRSLTGRNGYASATALFFPLDLLFLDHDATRFVRIAKRRGGTAVQIERAQCARRMSNQAASKETQNAQDAE
ncbi:MAG: hypothetical protein ACFB3T_00060 [Geminicoccaceae bacterium]